MSCRSGLKINKNKKSPSADEQQALLECFAPDYNELVGFGQMFGVPALNHILETFGGTKPHISKKEIFWSRLSTACRDEQLRMAFTGINHEELANMSGLTVRQVYRIVNGN